MTSNISPNFLKCTYWVCVSACVSGMEDILGVILQELITLFLRYGLLLAWSLPSRLEC